MPLGPAGGRDQMGPLVWCASGAYRRSAGTAAEGVEQKEQSLGYHSAADTEVTAPQMAAQTPSDRSNTTVKDAPSDQCCEERSSIHRTTDR